MNFYRRAVQKIFITTWRLRQIRFFVILWIIFYRTPAKKLPQIKELISLSFGILIIILMLVCYCRCKWMFLRTISSNFTVLYRFFETCNNYCYETVCWIITKCRIETFKTICFLRNLYFHFLRKFIGKEFYCRGEW